MADKGILTYDQADSTGYTPDQNLIGGKFLHLGNMHTYEVIGFVWCGEDDTWRIEHVREDIPDGVRYARSPSNFFGNRSNGEPRYHYQPESHVLEALDRHG